MFKGMNELVVNEATMIEAFQYWLANKVFNPNEPAPKVTSVKPSGCAYSQQFAVHFSGPVEG